jgi:serine/threonine-protein kinase
MQPDTLTTAAQARVGQVLSGKWRLDALLGVGGMGAVYVATHRNGKRVAIKVLHASLAMLDDARTRFLSEGYAANAVGHRGAVSVLDDDVTEDGAVFLVVEFLEGETLEARRERCGGRLPVTEVLRTGAGVLEVLASAHAAGIVHRDVKPENVFLTMEGEVKLLDFGIARVREISSRAGRTEIGSAMGTPAFMPPEQARGRWDELDARSDVWAVGAMMFTLLAGRHVHEGSTTNEVLLSAMTRPAPPLATAWPDAPPEVAAVVDRALQFRRDQRWEDATAMLAAVHAAARGDVPAETLPEAPLVLPRRRRLPALAAGLAALGLAGVLAAVARPRAHSPEPRAQASAIVVPPIAVPAFTTIASPEPGGAPSAEPAPAVAPGASRPAGVSRSTSAPSARRVAPKAQPLDPLERRD